jgi:hypothetical protein
VFATTWFRIVVSALLLGAGGAAGAQGAGGPPDGLPAALVAWAASDFAAHGPRPERIRNAHVRYAEGEDGGVRRYMLCGQFLPAGGGAKPGGAKPGWTQFATIATDPYEQWIGGQAEALCARARPSAGRVGDLSSTLEARLHRGRASAKRP